MSLKSLYPACSSAAVAASLRLPLRHPTQILVDLSGKSSSTLLTKSGLGENPSGPWRVVGGGIVIEGTDRVVEPNSNTIYIYDTYLEPDGDGYWRASASASASASETGWETSVGNSTCRTGTFDVAACKLVGGTDVQVGVVALDEGKRLVAAFGGSEL